MKTRKEELARLETENQMFLFEAEATGGTHGNDKCVTGLSPTGHCGAAVYCTEPAECCAACSNDCNIRCRWIPKKGHKSD